MSETNVDLVRRLYASFNRGEREPLFAALDEQVEWRGAQDSEPHRGHDGVRRSIAAWSESLEGATFEPEELTDAGDHVIGVVRSRGRGRASGIEVADVFFPVFTFRDGKIVRFEEFSTRDQALAAAASD